MAPTVLVVGSTGNTGKSVVHSLPRLLQNSKTLSGHRILGLTRSLNSPTAQKLAALPNVDMAEKDWTKIDADWLREHQVVRVYIAPHNQPSQFAEESAFYNALLQAEVEYVVKVSTNVKYVGPTNPVYYGRSHWAIENLLSQPEFKNLKWTALQPNFFTATYLASAAGWIKEYRKTGKQEVFKTNVAEDAVVAMIDPYDIGEVGAHLLALDDVAPHNQARYVLSGPEDINGNDIVQLIEKFVGVKVEKAEFKDVSWIDDLAKSGAYSAKVLSSIRFGCIPLWEEACSLAGTPTSKEIVELAAPKRTPAQALEAMLEG
ncbi:NAD(P)-binding protein [Aureobasidium pullulans]|nr:NAD(P)-binding protein [Aureobasidium pullulans]